MSRRSFPTEGVEPPPPQRKRSRFQSDSGKQHTLDSDEEDHNSADEGELDADDIEGEEEGVARQESDGVRMTAFNMREELEEGHFDRHGHFIWSNEAEIRDNWLDNVDWEQIDRGQAEKYEKMVKKQQSKSLGAEPDDDDDSSTSSDDNSKTEHALYKCVLQLMQPTETVNRAIKRLGGANSKLSSLERLKRKKAGTLTNSNEDCMKLTELANKILTKTGNMDVYQETYEEIAKKVEPPKLNVEPELDMYSDDFGAKEKQQISTTPVASKGKEEVLLKWEFKWNQNDDDTKIEGPFDTAQMLKWSRDGHFKTGVWVRKCGENTAFYSSNRIDFDLYV